MTLSLSQRCRGGADGGRRRRRPHRLRSTSLRRVERTRRRWPGVARASSSCLASANCDEACASLLSLLFPMKTSREGRLQGATPARLGPLARTPRCLGAYATPYDEWATPGCGCWISRVSSTGIWCTARLSSKRLDLATGGRVRTSPLLDASRQLEDVAASRHRERDGEELLRENCELVDGRPTSRAHARGGDLDAELCRARPQIRPTGRATAPRLRLC